MMSRERGIALRETKPVPGWEFDLLARHGLCFLWWHGVYAVLLQMPVFNRRERMI